jgi:hypothetical protein
VPPTRPLGQNHYFRRSKRRCVVLSTAGRSQSPRRRIAREALMPGLQLQIIEGHRVTTAQGTPDEAALMQSPRQQPDAEAVAEQDLHAIGALVGEDVGAVRLRRTESCDHSSQVVSGPERMSSGSRASQISSMRRTWPVLAGSVTVSAHAASRQNAARPRSASVRSACRQGSALPCAPSPGPLSVRPAP